MENDAKLTFYCQKPCGYKFREEPESEQLFGDEMIPVATCPQCGELAKHAYWERNIAKAAGLQTGPKSIAGKQKSASNLDGFPTPEQQKYIRLNALKNGAYAKTAQFYPAKPGKYPECENCHHRHEFLDDASHCVTAKACLKRAEIFVASHIAQAEKNPEVLRPFMADLQAGTMGVIQSMLLDIAQKGVREENPLVKFNPEDKAWEVVRIQLDDGTFSTVMESKENPVLKRFMEYMHKNGMTLTDLNMTPKIQEEQKQFGGNIGGETSRESIEEMQQAQRENMESIRELLHVARKNREQDPTLIELREETGGD